MPVGWSERDIPFLVYKLAWYMNMPMLAGKDVQQLFRLHHVPIVSFAENHLLPRCN